VLKKVALVLAALLALYLGVGWLIRMLASDETKIRWLVEGMEQAYNTGDAGDCVAPLARNWRHEGYEIDRQFLLGAVFQASRERDKETREMLTRVDVDEDALAITVDGERATLAAEAVFSRLRKGEWQETWRIRVEGELVDGEDGWEILRTRHSDVRGTHLGR